MYIKIQISDKFIFFALAIMPKTTHNTLFMKYLLFLASFIFISTTNAQTDTKPPKLRIEPGFLSTRYELGDKTTPEKQVALHLKQYEPDAYIKWKDADRAASSSLLWSIIGLGGILVGVLAEEPETRLAGYGVGVVGTSMTLITSISEKTRRQKAIDIYNTKYGY